jgi:hypothetical protein
LSEQADTITVQAAARSVIRGIDPSLNPFPSDRFSQPRAIHAQPAERRAKISRVSNNKIRVSRIVRISFSGRNGSTDRAFGIGSRLKPYNRNTL